MYAQKFQVDVLIHGQRRPCPLEWLDQFSMRNFTNSADFDDTLPVAEGRLEASFRLTPERFAEGLAAWLTQRGKGEGQPVQVEVKRVVAAAFRGGRCFRQVNRANYLVRLACSRADSWHVLFAKPRMCHASGCILDLLPLCLNRRPNRRQRFHRRLFPRAHHLRASS